MKDGEWEEVEEGGGIRKSWDSVRRPLKNKSHLVPLK